MLDRCQAYLVAKTPAHVTDLRHVVAGAGFRYCLDIATGGGTADPGAPIKFFFVHFRVADSDMLSTLATIRASHDDNLRFSPFVLIINDCAYEDIIKYVHLGFDDVISLPEKAPIIHHRLETLLTLEQTYFETPSYFGPDRRRMELVPLRDKRRQPKVASTSAIVLNAIRCRALELFKSCLWPRRAAHRYSRLWQSMHSSG